ncbi:hypothetical protein [Leeuwenhoekiella marinoflava]|uniref:Uncharacterized protein n=2 Tax=Leeuwenhoekiella marinoflava TaxID=988 RepID=A0A4Q0PNL0_9FLAO|nr:hypothetical protein [Leeuwenhoekiella marinoflava]RXG32043.1 hypothetical protein DSL99_1348 [Leeuwenhoekiella marinoflava]SHE95968.1 hypothetical protein SAMN02745246_01403 [Leeuwenhoekiella marinoflava DSM 3653]
MTTKKDAIKLLQKETKRGLRFNELLPLLGGMKAPQQHRYYNRAGFSATNLKSLEYDIKQVYGISNADLRSPSAPQGGTDQDSKESQQAADQQVAQSGTEDSKNETKEAENVKKTGDSVTLENVFELAPDEVKKDIKLRERYPFLNEEETPEEFYTLVGINGRAYFQMLAAREELFKKIIPSGDDTPPVEEPMSKEEIFNLAIKAVENFELNLEGTEELDYYQEHKEVLGKHPIFEERMLDKKVNDYKATYLATRRGNLKNYIGRESKKLEGMEAEARAAAVIKIRTWEKELALVEERMELPAEDRYQSAING